MKRVLIALIALVIMCGPNTFLHAKDAKNTGSLLAQEEEDFLGAEENFLDKGDEQKRIEEERKKREADEKKKRDEEERQAEEAKRQAEEAKRTAIKERQLKERNIEEARAKELDGLRESLADTTEYTLDPSSVELVVEMDPNGYGFRTRSHRMVMSAEVDLLLRGRGMLHYDYRFFNYLSIGILAGLDWSDVSLYNRFRDDLAKRSPRQFSVLGGAAAKWRLTEWYMKSAFFLEPSLLVGHMWQNLIGMETTHWRLRPGLFGGTETVFDSGLSLSTRLGVEFPFDFGTENSIKEVAEPLLVVGFGFAI